MTIYEYEFLGDIGWEDAARSYQRGKTAPLAKMVRESEETDRVPTTVRELLARIVEGTEARRISRPEKLTLLETRMLKLDFRAFMLHISDLRNHAHQYAEELDTTPKAIRELANGKRSLWIQAQAKQYGCGEQTIKNAIRGWNAE